MQGKSVEIPSTLTFSFSDEELRKGLQSSSSSSSGGSLTPQQQQTVTQHFQKLCRETINRINQEARQNPETYHNLQIENISYDKADWNQVMSGVQSQQASGAGR